jgi:hypothetical protein
MKCLHITLRRMASRTSIQSKLQAAPGRFTQATALKVSASYAATRHPFHVHSVGRAAYSQPCSPAPTLRSSEQLSRPAQKRMRAVELADRHLTGHTQTIRPENRVWR